jgi:hypothetical protein
VVRLLRASTKVSCFAWPVEARESAKCHAKNQSGAELFPMRSHTRNTRTLRTQRRMASSGGEDVVGDAHRAEEATAAGKPDKHHKHVPRVLWNKMQEDKAKSGGGENNNDVDPHKWDTRAVGIGKKGGPSGAREVGGVMRSQAELERANPRNLQRMVWLALLFTLYRSQNTVQLMMTPSMVPCINQPDAQE